MKRALYRIADANINRCFEGLRVCEDIFRFVVANKAVSSRFKNLRIRLKDILADCRFKRDLLRSRDSVCDLGRSREYDGFKRLGVADIFFANSQRAKEALRVIEEVFKVIDSQIAVKVKSARYILYTLESDAAGRLETLRNSRQADRREQRAC